jgi:hypothetical protein
LRDRLRPRRLIRMTGEKDAEVERLRVSNRDTAGDYVIRILIFNGIITYIIVADAERVANRRRRYRRRRYRRRRYGIISSSESETLAAALLFFD